MTFSGGYAGPAEQLLVTGGGTLYFPVADPNLSGTLDIASGAVVAGNAAAFGTATLKFDGGSVAASTALGGATAIPNAIIFGGNQSINVEAAATRILGTSAIEFSGPVSLAAGGTYTFNDPNGLSTFSGVISGPGAIALSPNGGNPNNNYNWNNNQQSNMNPILSGFNTYSGGTTINSGIVRIASRQAFGTGPLDFNWGGLQALVPLTGDKAVANPWSDIANFNNGELWLRGSGSLELSGPGTIAQNAMFRIPDGGTLTISGAVTGNGYFQRGGDGNGTLVLNNPLSTYNGSNGGRNDGWIRGTDGNDVNNTYNIAAYGGNSAYAMPQVSFTKNDNGGNVVVMASSTGSDGYKTTGLTASPFGTGTVNWQVLEQPDQRHHAAALDRQRLRLRGRHGHHRRRRYYILRRLAGRQPRPQRRRPVSRPLHVGQRNPQRPADLYQGLGYGQQQPRLLV